MTISHSSPDPRLDFPHVTIGVITALNEEYEACLKIFDPTGTNGIERETPAIAGSLTCWLCLVPAKNTGEHVVAITKLVQMGNSAAAITAQILFHHCAKIESLIMCGIAGAVPHPTKSEQHVRLGDIVVSGPQGIVQYDFGKQRYTTRVPKDPFNGFEFRFPPRPPCRRLLTAVDRMHAAELSLDGKTPREWELKIQEFLHQNQNASKWKRPPSTKGKLIDTPNGAGTEIKHPNDPKRRSNWPRVFQGAIGAANIVLADPKKRDALRDRWSIRAVEMESSGIADASWVANIGYLVVRGTCDFCNSSKNDDWHMYAALIAAAYSRTVIEHLHVQRAVNLNGISANDIAASVESASGDRRRPETNTGRAEAVNSPQSMLNRPQDESVSTHRGTQAVVIDTFVATTITEPPPAPKLHPNVTDGLVSPEERQIKDLTQRMQSELDRGDLKKAISSSDQLERLLRAVPARGNHVREGWLLLAKVEAGRLRTQLIPNRTPDVSRLRQLREEAENVVD